MRGGQCFCVGGYRYGFNGMERDDNVKGKGNSYTTEFRQYDPRVGRWLSIDPMVSMFADISPYVAYANNPIYYKDPSGLAPGNGDEGGDGNKGNGDHVRQLPSNPSTDWDPDRWGRSETGTSQKTPHKKSDWSLTLEPGWATNIDFSLGSASGDYKFNGIPVGINSAFESYDSKENFIGFQGDQANHYLLTAKNESNGLTITGGDLHDKRAQFPSIDGSKFTYVKGGISPAIMFGYQYDISFKNKNKFGFQVKGGAFMNLDNIGVDLFNMETDITYSSSSSGRRLAGGGFVAMMNVSYSYIFKKYWCVSLSINGTYMTGIAYTTVNATDNSTGNVSSGTISIDYSSLSLGPSLGLSYRFLR